MTAKNFNIKNGLSVGGVEVIDSSGNIAAGGVGAAVQEAIADKIGGIIQGSGSTTVTYDDAADTITISSTGKTTEEIQDIVGGMMSGNTEAGITVAYEDGDGTVDFTVSLSSFDTDALSEGSSNLYYTDARADARIAAADTDALSEGSSNLYYTDARADARIAAADTDALSEGSSNLYYTDARADARVQNAIVDSDTFAGASATSVPSSESTKAYVDAQTTDETAEGSTNLYFTEARVKSYLGGGSFDGNIIPSADNTYDLGSSSKMWKDVYIGPGSLYVNGQKVIEEESGTIVFSADANQNMSIQPSGSGDLELDPTGSGVIAVKGPFQIEDGQNITNSAGNAVSFSNNIVVDQIASKSTDTNLVLSGNGTGNVTLNDNVAITGDLTVSGTTTTVNSETISLADNIIALNSNFTSGSPTEDSGLSITRGGSTAKTLLWDETNDKWTVGSETFVAGTFEGNLTGNVTGNTSGSAGTVSSISGHNISVLTNDSGYYKASDNVSLGTIASGAITITNATNGGGTARNVYQSTSAPTGSDGAVGDLWVLYS